MYKTHFKSGGPIKIALYKKFANKLNHKKERSKKNYVHNEINTHKSSPKKLWETLRQILPFNKTQTHSTNLHTKLSNEKTYVEDPTDVAETFIKYFVNIGKILAEKFSVSSPSLTNC